MPETFDFLHLDFCYTADTLSNPDAINKAKEYEDNGSQVGQIDLDDVGAEPSSISIEEWV